MELLWGILVFTTLLHSNTYAGRVVPINARPIMKRMGPFFNNRRVYNHPYIEDHHTRSHPAEVREQLGRPQQLPSAQISQRKLLMPIISEGYASTKFQGGVHSKPEIKDKAQEKKIQMKANVIEQATVQELQTTRRPISTSSAPPVPTSATGDVSLAGPVEEPLSSPYFPDIPDLIAQGATEDTSKNYEASSDSALSSLTSDINSSEDVGNGSPFIIREDEYAYPPPPPVPVPQPPTRAEIRPTPPKLASERIDIGSGSVESVSPYDDSLSAPVVSGTSSRVDVQTNSDGYVRLVATPPKKFKIVGSESSQRLPLANVDDKGFYRPQKARYSEKYLAGYEQIDFPEQDGIFPGNINPDLIDPDDYHQDRPSFQASQVHGGSPKEYYPLGKPPPSPQVTPDLLAKGQDQKFSFNPNADNLKEKKQESKGSFFDFLIPSFVRSSNRADPEGPRPQPARPQPPVPRQKPGRNSPPPPPSAPQAPKVPDFSNFPHLKNPNRPLNTFPPPHELGGKLNPILIRVPEGFKPSGPFQPQSALKKIGLSRVDAEPNLVEDEEEILEPIKPQPSIVSLPPSPPLLRRPRPPNGAPIQMTSQPSGLSRVQTPKRKTKPIRTPLLNLPGIPQTHQRYPHPDLARKDAKLDLKAYKEKLRDPDFHQNLTKAHVYHASDLEEEVEEVDRENYLVPSLTKALLSYLQDANPFNFRPRSETTQPPIVKYKTYQIEQINPEKLLEVTESRLPEVAPPAKPTKIEKLDDYEVVYRPTTTSSTTTPKTTTSTTPSTTTTTTTTSTQTTTTHDPIADHVNLLLQQYFSTQTPDTDSNGVPMITYDDENNSIVMEYLSPDGELDKNDDASNIEEKEIASAEQPALKVPSFFPEPENPEKLLLPKPMTNLDRLFEPSQKTGAADWFVLDENGRRRLRIDEEEFPPSDAKDVTLEEETGIDSEDIEANTERVTVSDFEPMTGSPIYEPVAA